MPLVLLVTVVWVGLSLLGQRLTGALLGVRLPIRPLLPFAVGTPALKQVVVRLGGAVFTWLLLFATAGVQFTREAEWSTRIEVVNGMPAALAGLRTGDVVLRVGEHQVRDFSELKDRLGFGGAQQKLTVLRDGAELSFTVKAGDSVLGIKRSEERANAPDKLGALGRAATLIVRVLPLVGDTLPNGLVWLLMTAALAWWMSVVLEVLAFGVNALSSGQSGR
ncbi:MAG: PDZ domain-containing protein [Archangium sp.]